ncbi:MAG: O-antigen ligase family protein [Abditibacteriota bacterium]|nr:O-antigen ligase family protein [Abditibacteriota bacterium]
MQNQNAIAEKLVTVYFVGLAVLMNYFINNSFYFARILLSYQHLFMIIIIVSGIAYFLVYPNLGRIYVIGQSALAYSVALFVTATVSLFIWFTKQTPIPIIERGINSYFIYKCDISGALCAGVFLYIWGEKGIWRYLTAVIIANFMTILTIMVQNGVGEYMQQFITLVTTFARVTGPLMLKAEVHELAFCLGGFLLLMILFPKYIKEHPLLFSLAGFGFLSAFKRIAILAIGVAFVTGFLLLRFSKIRNSYHISKIISMVLIVITVLLLGYIALVKNDFFTDLELAGVETSGRDVIYRHLNRFYEFSPSFTGNGMAFTVYQMKEMEGSKVAVVSAHNDFLMMFIDLGFVGFLLWYLAFTVVRTKFFGREKHIRAEIFVFALIIMQIINSCTDNTLLYPLFSLTVAMLMMSCDFDKRVRNADRRFFGFISDANKSEAERENTHDQ